MPCNSDYMEQDGLEKHIQTTARLVKFVKNKLGLIITKEENELDTSYPNRSKADFITERLCSLIKGMDAEERENIVWDAKNKTSRQLADWWDEHLAADRKRIYAEQEKLREEQLKKSALKKLTKAEKKALGL
jgi:hypothetical protein